MTSKAILDVVAERTRQQLDGPVGEGFNEHHDDEHDPGDLTAAAVCYASNACSELHPFTQQPIDDITEFWMAWPWEVSWWKPKGPREDLVRAAALLIAEIEKLDRASGNG